VARYRAVTPASVHAALAVTGTPRLVVRVVPEKVAAAVGAGK
jgi:hypothetical protein